MTDGKPIPFDSQAPWSTAGLETGYDLRIEPAGDTPKASIVIEPDVETPRKPRPGLKLVGGGY